MTRAHMVRRSQPTEPTATRGDYFRKQIDTTSLSATHLDILDNLAFVRADHEQPREGLTRDELFQRVAPGIWGHAAVAAAQTAGLTGRDNDELVRLGQRPYFERCLQRLFDEQALTETDGVVKLAKDRVRVRGQAGQNAYLPGMAKLQQRRRNLSDQASALLEVKDGKGGLRDLFPRMSPSQFAELVLSMRVEGFDESKPIVRDINTKQIIDGFHREEAAQQAGVQAVYMDRPFSNDLQRIRFAIRSNLIRRHLLKVERDELASRLAERHLSTREIAQMLGPLPDVSYAAARFGSDSERRKSKARSGGSSTNDGLRFGKSGRARWGSEDRLRQAERDALAMNLSGVEWVKIGELIYQKYELDKPLPQGTVYSMAKRAKVRDSE
jgi:hypothetical protein